MTASDRETPSVTSIALLVEGQHVPVADAKDCKIRGEEIGISFGDPFEGTSLVLRVDGPEVLYVLLPDFDGVHAAFFAKDVQGHAELVTNGTTYTVTGEVVGLIGWPSDPDVATRSFELTVTFS